MNPRFDTATVDPNKLVAAFAEVLQKSAPGFIEKTATGAPIGPYVHGPGGLFGVRGLSRDIISTHTQILGSLGEMLPIVPSQDINPLFPYITGFLRSDQQEKNAICDDPVAAGNMKTCIQTTVFGRKEFKTREMEVNRMGQRINRGEFMDLQLVNTPLVNQMGGLMQNFFGLKNEAAAIAGNDVVMRMVEVSVAFQRWYCPTVYTGNPANNSAGGGYKEFPGLQLLIGANKVDALSGVACPSLYSLVASFGYRNVTSVTDPDIVHTLTNMIRILKRKADQQGLSPVQLAFVMREPLFYELTRAWPCQYNTDGCLAPTLSGTSVQVSLVNDFQVRMRDEMRNGKYLLVDGYQVPVIVDDCIMEDNHADNASIPIGGFSSDIYIVPLTARGGTVRTMYWEYFDFQADVLPNMSNLPMWFWSDSGAFLWTMGAPKNWCVDLSAKTEPRLILRTPQLAARLQNVVYVPLYHTDDPLPSQDYHVNGGNRNGYPTASPYSEWNLGGPGIGA
jgi:hypothetical protein